MTIVDVRSVVTLNTSSRPFEGPVAPPNECKSLGVIIRQIMFPSTEFNERWSNVHAIVDSPGRRCRTRTTCRSIRVHERAPSSIVVVRRRYSQLMIGRAI